MFEPAERELTVEERAVLDARQYARMVEEFDPVTAPEHILGFMKGLADHYAKVVGNAKASKELTLLALKAYAFATCDEELKTRLARVVPPENVMTISDAKPGPAPIDFTAPEMASVVAFNDHRKPEPFKIEYERDPY